MAIRQFVRRRWGSCSKKRCLTLPYGLRMPAAGDAGTRATPGRLTLNGTGRARLWRPSTWFWRRGEGKILELDHQQLRRPSRPTIPPGFPTNSFANCSTRPAALPLSPTLNSQSMRRWA